MTRDKDVLHDVMIQIFKMGEEKILGIHEEGNLEGFCARILHFNLYSETSPCGRERLKHKRITPFSYGELYGDQKLTYADRNKLKGEWDYQKQVLNYIEDSNKFDEVDYLIVEWYFDTGYNFSQMLEEMRTHDVTASYGWVNGRLRDIKERMPYKLKRQWKEY